MHLDQQKIVTEISRWKAAVRDFSLPTWEELPSIPLYMDQVVIFLGHCLAPHLEEKPLNASTINNYVRTRMMPSPVKKKYFRLHLAYLIMICTLRHGLSMTSLQRMLPLTLSESAFRELYNQYVAQHKIVSTSFMEQLSPLIGDPEADMPDGLRDQDMDSLIASTASVAILSKLLTEQLIALRHYETESKEPAGD